MEVSEVVCLTYKQGPQVFVPSNLVVIDDKSRKWLKLRSSSPAMAKLVAGHMAEFKKLKNPSLAASPQLSAIQDKIKAAVLEQEKVDDGNMFGESGTGEQPEASVSYKNQRRKWRPALYTAGTVPVKFGSADVELKTPSSWKERDIVLPLEAEALTVVCEFIMEDVAASFEEKKRSYVKSGNFAKRAKTTDTDSNEEWRSLEAGRRQKKMRL